MIDDQNNVYRRLSYQALTQLLEILYENLLTKVVKEKTSAVCYHVPDIVLTVLH